MCSLNAMKHDLQEFKTVRKLLNDWVERCKFQILILFLKIYWTAVSVTSSTIDVLDSTDLPPIHIDRNHKILAYTV